jgi:hypothetical protein
VTNNQNNLKGFKGEAKEQTRYFILMRLGSACGQKLKTKAAPSTEGKTSIGWWSFLHCR